MAQTGTPPKRFLFCFAGQSVGNTGGSLVPPTAAGADYPLSRGLVTLAGRQLGDVAPSGLEYNSMITQGLDYDDVRGEFSVVSGLKIPWQTGSEVPPGGRVVQFHGSSVGVVLSGVRALEPTQRPRGPSADQVVAETLVSDEPGTYRSLSYRVQAAGYKSDNNGGARSRMSYARGDNGDLIAIDPVVSPRLAYEQLFRNFQSSDPEEAVRRERRRLRDRSVLDLVRGSSERLRGRLGSADRRTMERYFDEIRDLELRIDAIPAVAVGVCRELPDPGEDPPIEVRPCDTSDPDTDCERYPYMDGHSNEDLRASVLFDMVHMAFACDITRVASVQFTYPQSYLNVSEITGYNEDVHGTGHQTGNPSHIADVYAWQVKHLARLVHKLRETPDEDGSSMLDNTAIVFVCEGGYGFDPASDDGSDRPRAHSTENMVVLVGGRAGSLRPGRHIVATNRHPVEAVVAAMNAVGVEGGLGDVSPALSELF